MTDNIREVTPTGLCKDCILFFDLFEDVVEFECNISGFEFTDKFLIDEFKPGLSVQSEAGMSTAEYDAEEKTLTVAHKSPRIRFTRVFDVRELVEIQERGVKGPDPYPHPQPEVNPEDDPGEVF